MKVLLLCIVAVLGLMSLGIATIGEANTTNKDFRWKIVQPYNDKLNRIAYCESGRNWAINTGNGYYGGLQFLLSSWRSVGGRGYPHQNSELEQKYRAVLLIRIYGYKPWPVCRYR